MEPSVPGTLSDAEFGAAAGHFCSWWSAQSGRQQPWQWTVKQQPVTEEEVGYLAMERIQQSAAAATSAAPTAAAAAAWSPAQAQTSHDAADGDAAPAEGGRSPADDTQHAMQPKSKHANGHAAAAEAARSLHADDTQQDIPDIWREDSDEACVALVPNHATAVLLWEYQIVYHTSYQVPALCFRAMTADGVVLSEGELLAQLPCMQRYKGSDVPDWAFITQMEHPVLHTPWLVLHPCQTAERMALMLSALTQRASARATAANSLQHAGADRAAHGASGESSALVNNCIRAGSKDHAASWLRHYMPAWFSLVAPVVGLTALYHP